MTQFKLKGQFISINILRREYNIKNALPTSNNCGFFCLFKYENFIKYHALGHV